MHSDDLPLTFGIKAGELIHVDEVPNGLACECHCPACGESLIARQGAKTVHHFAHAGGSECKRGVQTALHLAAKTILVREKRMRLPALSVMEAVKDGAGKPHTGERGIIAKTVDFEEVREEVHLGAVVPDIVAMVGGRALLVEVAVHHFVDEAKRDKLRQLGRACVQVDLSGMLQGWNWETLRDALVDGETGKAWIHNPRESALRLSARQDAQVKAQLAERGRRMQRAQIPGFEQAEERLAEMLRMGQFDIDRAAHAALAPRHPWWTQPLTQTQGMAFDHLPEHVGIPVAGESGFLVDRRVWQAALYAQFVRGPTKTFAYTKAIRWCLQVFPCRTEFAALQKNPLLLSPELRAALPWATRAVKAYLQELVQRGVLKAKGGMPARYEVLQRRAP